MNEKLENGFSRGLDDNENSEDRLVFLKKNDKKYYYLNKKDNKPLTYSEIINLNINDYNSKRFCLLG